MIVNEDYILVVGLGPAGMLPEDANISIKAPSSVSFMDLELTEENFIEAQFGFYNILIPKEIINELGTFLFKVDGYETELIEDREAQPKPFSSSPPPEVCIVTGNIRNIAGQAEVFDNVLVSVAPIKLPLVMTGSLTLGRAIDTRTDFDGFFSIPVIRGAEVRFEIKKSGVRFQATIPDVDTIRIEDLMP